MHPMTLCRCGITDLDAGEQSVTWRHCTRQFARPGLVECGEKDIRDGIVLRLAESKRKHLSRRNMQGGGFML